MLEYRFPELAEAVERADRARQRAASRVAVELACQRTGIDGRDVDRALTALAEGRFGETYERVMVRDLAERLDREADESVGEAFRLACAARALTWALHDNPRRAAAESIYCAIVALDEDLSEIEPAVRAELQGSSG